MPKRRAFLLGLLAGLLLGAGSLMVRDSVPPTPATPALLPSQPVLVQPALRQGATPPNWGHYEFNGRPVYIIPLGPASTT